MLTSSTYHKKRKKKIAKRFEIVLAEKPNMQEAIEKSRNNWQNEQKHIYKAAEEIK